MREKKRLVAGGLAIAAAGTIAATIFIARTRITEAWHLHWLAHGSTNRQLAALEWLGENGDERTYLALVDWAGTRWGPFFVLPRGISSHRWSHLIGEPPPAPGIDGQLDLALLEIRGSMGSERLIFALLGALRDPMASPAVRLHASFMFQERFARWKLEKSIPEAEGPSRRYLIDTLSDPDPLRRSFAAVLATWPPVSKRLDATDRQRLEALRNDPDQRIRALLKD